VYSINNDSLLLETQVLPVFVKPFFEVGLLFFNIFVSLKKRSSYEEGPHYCFKRCNILSKRKSDVSSQGHFKLYFKTIASVSIPWGITWLPDGSMLITY
jgi:hypothetical protein